jgi:hypothetical protein
MKMKNLFAFTLLMALFNISFLNAWSQSSKSGDCGCSQALEETIDKVSRIYAGFDDKVTPQTRPVYDKLVSDLRKKAHSNPDSKTCITLLKSYTSFFKDSHVFIHWMGGAQNIISNMEANKNRTDLVAFKQLNKDFVYAKLAVFDQREVGQLDSMLIANADILAKTPYMIVDLRGNGGGNTATSDEMARLIYTNPMVYPAWDYRSSEEHIRQKERELKSAKDTTDLYYLRSLKLLNAMKANPGEMVKDSGDLIREMDVSPAHYPKHIAFLIDKGCGSATEFYIFEGKQSTKVTVFGQNSHGVMDYGSDQDFRICDGIYSLATPWGRNGWVKDFRIDNVGFEPDVRIAAKEKDWIAFVQRYYERRDKLKK